MYVPVMRSELFRRENDKAEEELYVNKHGNITHPKQTNRNMLKTIHITLQQSRRFIKGSLALALPNS